ncbi:MAG: SUF system Fe-S cluster assembly regulator [Planctomycetes bacterium]|nr:SUF system Fe-S cluster assembly regulator [Planctomycetota bacterium]
MIRITRQTDYGIVLLSHMARGGSAEVHTAPELAEASRLPLPMVSKILKLLTRAGLLGSQRGVKGGYRLARPPAEITVSAMVAALEGPVAITACVADAETFCEHAGSCATEANWQLINRAIREVLDRITLADMTCQVLAHTLAGAKCGRALVAAAPRARAVETRPAN